MKLSAISLLGVFPIALAAPAPVPGTAPTQRVAVRVPAPEPTAPAEILKRGNVGDDTNTVGPEFGIVSDVKSAFSDVESHISTFVVSHLSAFPTSFPFGTQVEGALGISSSDLAAEPTQVLNVPPYANWTKNGWNVRVHGNVYKTPNISESKIDDLANDFLIGESVKDLNDTGKAQARNVTRSIFVVQQSKEQVTVNFVPNVAVKPNNDGGAVNAAGGAQTIKLPYNTTAEGDFDVFVPLKNTTGANGGYLKPGNETSHVQTLNVYTTGTDSGNATAYLVPTNGLTIVSDIDDILRVTKIYEPKQGLLNTFANPFTPWLNMPEIYANWSASVPDFHFHYLTTTPEQITRNYMDFIYKTYPLGSFDTRPLNFSDTSATFSIRKFLLEKVIETFPERKFILIADTSNSDVMSDYPQMYHDHPNQIQCIWLRNTSSTDSGDDFPYNTKGFKGIPQDRFMFFKVPDDLTHLDVANGQCYNSTIVQNVTFSDQGLPLGLGDKGSSAAVLASNLNVLALSGLVAAIVAFF